MARTLDRSVLEVLEEDDLFISRRLSKRDHMDPRRRLSVDHGNDHSSEKAQGHKTLLVIREAIVLESKGRTLKYSGRIDEVQPMILQVKTTFPFIPGKPHSASVYTFRLCVNRRGCLRSNDLVERPGTMPVRTKSLRHAGSWAAPTRC